MSLRPVRWSGRGSTRALEVLDQRSLPGAEVWLTIRTWREAARAIADMAVRGAPAIGLVGAFGVVLALAENDDPRRAAKGLVAVRPTAANLQWAVTKVLNAEPLDFETALGVALALEEDDLRMNRRIGELGATLVPENANILTLCNTGALATAGHGTALGVVRSAAARGLNPHVWVCETRPRLQGLRLTAYELAYEKIPFTVVVDSAAAALMRAERVDLVVVGADRIAANGDVANKIGTYMLAVCARRHGIPFYVAAPRSTFDPTLPSGAGIVIEERSGSEITHLDGISLAPSAVETFNPGFDVTPAELVTAIIADSGLCRPPYAFGERA